MPKPQKIDNQKELADAIVNEVQKVSTGKDTLFLITYNPEYICGSQLYHGTPFEEKILALKYAIKSRYVFDKQDSFQPVYKKNDQIIVTGTSTSGGEGCSCFRSGIANFDYLKVKEKQVYEIKYTAIGNDKTEVTITDFNSSQGIKSIVFIRNANKWILD